MKKLVCVFVGLCIAGAAWAQEVQGDAKAGQAKTATCAGCHGADGNAAGMFPKLAGQNAKYLIKQINDIKSGARPVPAMTGMVENLSEQDIADIAAYFASQKVQVGQANKELVKLGERVYRAGDQTKGLAACTACHSPTGHGNPSAGFPAVGGQNADYTEKQLKAFRAAGRNDIGAEKRENDPASMMRSIAAKLSDEEIKAVSSYISGLH